MMGKGRKMKENLKTMPYEEDFFAPLDQEGTEEETEKPEEEETEGEEETE